ncbi:PLASMODESMATA CALLOSE-BINDING PROTEIN 2-like [Rutidosis leptorrhynchoides]|uniref:PLASMODESMATA CALLOSE-BINDING PROTEIN 2-like n=1 Tax=Rutidosis leptorrhynchoides TaxID=125765 RepID=UPI003A995F9F
MAALVLIMLIFAMTGHSSATWCVCKQGADAILQKTLDYACGAGGDCSAIHEKGACFNPNTVRSHCNYAVNSFFQNKKQAQGTCDFAGTATISTSDPSTPGCIYSANPGSGTTPTGTTSPATTTPSTTTTVPNTGTTNPYSSTPAGGGMLGGINGGTSGLGPSGSGMNDDISRGGPRLHASYLFMILFITLVCFQA